MTLQRETAKHIGRNLNLVVNGTVIGFHPIESAPLQMALFHLCLLTENQKRQSMLFYNKLEVSVRQIQLELQRQRN